jgi:hypothetical protein
MAYQKRIPPIKIILDIESFNQLVETISIFSENPLNEKIQAKATKLKEKLLRYSVPRTEENDTEIDIRFYPNEAEDLINMLIANIKDIEINTNYYEVLLKVREETKKKYNESE